MLAMLTLTWLLRYSFKLVKKEKLLKSVSRIFSLVARHLSKCLLELLVDCLELLLLRDQLILQSVNLRRYRIGTIWSLGKYDNMNIWHRI